MHRCLTWWINMFFSGVCFSNILHKKIFAQLTVSLQFLQEDYFDGFKWSVEQPVLNVIPPAGRCPAALCPGCSCRGAGHSSWRLSQRDSAVVGRQRHTELLCTVARIPAQWLSSIVSWNLQVFKEMYHINSIISTKLNEKSRKHLIKIKHHNCQTATISFLFCFGRSVTLCLPNKNVNTAKWKVSPHLRHTFDHFLSM